VKAFFEGLKKLGCQILLGNTYHLFCGGHELIDSWADCVHGLGRADLDRQRWLSVFSRRDAKISETARVFSHLGRFFTPAHAGEAVAIQEALGSDIAMVSTNACHDARCVRSSGYTVR
jgi:queuine/archaeosine tRNA-ribosyltransferase